MQAMLQMEKIDIAWLVETRNTIEKEGDIEPASKLQLTFCDDWLADETEGIDFPPSYSSEKAAVLFSKLLRPTTKISLAQINSSCYPHAKSSVVTRIRPVRFALGKRRRR